MGEEKPIRLLNFVSEEQVLTLNFLNPNLGFAFVVDWILIKLWEIEFLKLEESKKERGERVEDGTFQRDRALYEVFSPITPSIFMESYSAFDQIVAEWFIEYLLLREKSYYWILF